MDNAKKINIPNECKELFAEFGAKMFNKLGFFEFGKCRCEEYRKALEEIANEEHNYPHLIAQEALQRTEDA